jgi:MoaA/NifB/PqqE/SkfB family radical SAM enzyme/SAM-dependent methyltransferase
MKNNWQRIVFRKSPIYVHRHSADWFVPNAHADALLQSAEKSFAYEQLKHRISSPNPFVYSPKVLSKTLLQEFWIHLTNRCNLSCTHCLFSSSPVEKDTLSFEKIVSHVNEAYALGCRLFIISGGEPLVHPELLALVEDILGYEGSEVVILTNGVLLEKVFAGKSFSKERLHFQISLDGLPKEHDALRGKGSFEKLESNIAWLQKEGYRFSLSVCLHPLNILSLDAITLLVRELGASHLHFLWYFSRGRGENEGGISNEILFDALIKAYETAQKLGLVIDNFEALKTQIFAPKGTVHDGSSSGRSSLALGYDGHFYPSAAMVGEGELLMEGESITDALESPVAWAIASQSVTSLSSPLRFLLGGGDLDHSFAHAKTFMGDDPYEPLLEKLALWLITQEAKRFESLLLQPALCLEMGDILQSCGANEGVAHTHANCLLATGESESLRLVKAFYHDAALEDKESILNPACYEEQYLSHIPTHLRFRGYGCGSPILDANLKQGECMLDLGSGRGIECFIASKLVGKSGRVVGVDMLDSMLAIARSGAEEVAHGLGYTNLSFTKGYLETLPFEAEHFDVITSNCVLNLSSHKRKLFSEIFRVLKKGGRLVVSDVICDEEASAIIRNDAKLSGECIGGALTQAHLLGLLRESGFENVELLKRFFYREVQGHLFYSLTFVARKPESQKQVDVIYKGVGESLTLENGIVLFKGVKTRIDETLAKLLEREVFLLDENGAVRNQEGQSCCCATPPESKSNLLLSPKPTAKVTFSLSPPKQSHNCMVCTSELVYGTTANEVACYYCGNISHHSVTCKEGHYVCDACHAKEALAVIEHICKTSKERDMLKLFRQIREHPSIPKHGPEHHAMVPAIIVTAYKNSGGKLPENALKTALLRGASVMGGACGFLGICGAASGVGIGFAIVLESSPVAKKARSTAQKVTHAVLGKIAEYEAARCCHREVWTALNIASSLSEEFLPVKLLALMETKCDQKKFNQYCYGKECPIF